MYRNVDGTNDNVTTIMIPANKFNAPSIPPVIKTESVGLSCSWGISTILPTFMDFCSSAVLLLTLWKNLFDLIILLRRYILVTVMTTIDIINDTTVTIGVRTFVCLGLHSPKG